MVTVFTCSPQTETTSDLYIVLPIARLRTNRCVSIVPGTHYMISSVHSEGRDWKGESVFVSETDSLCLRRISKRTSSRWALWTA